ncbi:MAG: TIGR00153 family protein [Candidatus Methanofastidiosia archaeon]
MIFGKKEDKVASLIDEHTALIDKCLEKFVETMESYLAHSYPECEKAGAEVHLYEKKADSIRREAQKKLYEGAFMPLYREDVHEFVDLLDAVADKAESLVNTIVLEHPPIPDSLIPDFKEIANKSVAPFENLKKAVHYFKKDRKKALEETEKVEKKEEIVDILECNIRKKIFENKIKRSEKIEIRSFAIAIADISDRIEDCSDILEIMAVKRQI